MGNIIPSGSNPTEIRRAFQWAKKRTDVVDGGASGEVLVGAGVGSIPQWGTELTALTLLTVDNITVNAAAITSDTGAISFGDENLSTTGTISGVNVTSGENPGHTHTGSSLSGIDISDDTNLAVTSPIVLTDDTLSLNQSAVDHGSIGGLTDDDHTIYLLADGTRELAGNLSASAGVTIDGRDLSVDGGKLDGIESGADVTDATNVAAAGAAMAGGAFHDGFSDYVAAEHVLLPAALASIVSDTTATGANLTTLTDDSMADTLHRHSELSASDGTPDPVLYADASGDITSDDGKLRLGDSVEIRKYKIEIWSDRAYGDGLLFSSADSTGASSASTLYCIRHRGTTASPTIVQNGDRLLRISGAGNDGHGSLAYKDAARIEMRVDAAPTVETSVPGSVAFMTSPDGSATPVDRMIVKNTGYVGVNATPDARFEVQTNSDDGQQAITIDQNDEDQAFIDYQGTSEAGTTKNITSYTSGNTIQGFVKIEINGTSYWMPYYNAPTS